MPAPSSITDPGCFTVGPTCNWTTATVSIALPASRGQKPQADAGKVTLTVYRSYGRPSEYEINPVASSADLYNNGAEPGHGIRGLEQAKWLMGVVRSAMTGGGWECTTRGGPGYSLSFRNPHARQRR